MWDTIQASQIWGSVGGGAAWLVTSCLLVGPLLGALIGELGLARKASRPAVMAGVGSVVGTLAAMGINIVIGIFMIAWFFIDVFCIG